MGKVRAQLGMAISYHLGRGIGTYYLENLHENVVPHTLSKLMAKTFIVVT